MPLSGHSRSQLLTLTPGQTLSHFRIVAWIGAGGMGVVYRAEDENLRRPVALKVLLPDSVGDKERSRRFLHEARAAAAVADPNIAIIHEVGETDGVVFIAMELVEGRTLREMLNAGPLSIQDAVRIASQIASGLACAHRAHVIHRDLKPENVIVRPDGQAKILDFGLARRSEHPTEGGDSDVSRQETLTETMTREGRLVGTVAYMSPEQARGKLVDSRSDLFALGATLYEMVTARRPFQGETLSDTLSAILRDQPVPAERINEKVPASLSRIIGRCLEKDATLRYQSAEEIQEDLKKTDSSRLGVNRHHRVAMAVAAVVMLALLSAIGLWRGSKSGPADQPHIESLVVLPLANLSGDPEQEYFSDGMTDALIANLAKISSLRVISRTSAMRYKGTDKPLARIARELGVSAVVEGSVMRSGSRVRIIAQLIEPTGERHLWGDTYEGDLRDVLGLQAEVATSIAREIRARVTPEERSLLGGARRVDPEAHQAYLKGRYFWNKRTATDMLRAIDHFERALQIDPEYAAAYAGLADCYDLLTDYQTAPAAVVFPKARRYAEKALSIDDTLAEAHNALAYEMFRYEWDWTGAEKEFQRALALSPGYTAAHYWYAEFLVLIGRFEPGIAQARLALDLDPLSLIINTDLGWFQYLARHNEAAFDQLTKALELDGTFPATHFMLGEVYLAEHRFPEAIREFEAHRGLASDSKTLGLGMVYALSGRQREALQIVSEMKRLAVVPTSAIGMVLGALGRNDEAFEWLERAFVARDDVLVYLRVHPLFDPLRSDPRFDDLSRRVGFPRP